MRIIAAAFQSFYLFFCIISFVSGADPGPKEELQDSGKKTQPHNIQVITFISTLSNGTTATSSGVPLAISGNSQVKYVVTALHSQWETKLAAQRVSTACPASIIRGTFDKGNKINTLLIPTLTYKGNQPLVKPNHQDLLSSMEKALTAEELKAQSQDSADSDSILKQGDISDEELKNISASFFSKTAITVGGDASKGSWTINSGQDIALVTLETPLSLAKGKIAAVLPSPGADFAQYCQQHRAFVIGCSPYEVVKGDKILYAIPPAELKALKAPANSQIKDGIKLTWKCIPLPSIAYNPNYGLNFS